MSAWKKTFISSFLAQVLSILGFSFALPFLPFFIQDLGIVDPAQQAWWAGVILSATGLTLALFAPLWGMLADRYGRKSMVMRSMFGGALVLLLMSFSRNIGELLVCRLLQGALTGTVSASVALVASVTPPRRSGFTLGMMQAAVMVGMAIGPLMGGIVADYFGYRMAFRVGAIVILAGGFLISFGAQESLPDAQEIARQRVSFRDLLKNNGFVFAILILLAVRFANTIVNPAFPLIVKDFIVSTARLNSTTGIIMSFSGLAGATAAGLLGHIGDKLGHKRVLIVCSIGAAITAAAHALARSIIDLTVIHLFFGMMIAGILPTVNAMIQRTTDQRHMGKAFGISSSISMMGLALGPLTGGFLASVAGVRAPFLAAGICQLLVAVLASRRSWKFMPDTRN